MFKFSTYIIQSCFSEKIAKDWGKQLRFLEISSRPLPVNASSNICMQNLKNYELCSGQHISYKTNLFPETYELLQILYKSKWSALDAKR